MSQERDLRLESDERRRHRSLRLRRHGRRAYIRSVYSLPSLATLGNAICGFGAIYVSVLQPSHSYADHWTTFFARFPFTIAAILIFVAMAFDGIDGRLARFTRHTTDFGGQLDSLADMISFGVAPAFLALQLFRVTAGDVPVFVSRAAWATGALYMSCAALRLARFNVSNEHGEQHHFSFLGLPSPGAAAVVASMVLLQKELVKSGPPDSLEARLALVCVWFLPAVVLMAGLAMVSTFRYPHLINRYLRGKRALGRVIAILTLALLVIVAPIYTMAIGTFTYTLWGPVAWLWARSRPRPPQPLPQTPAST